MSAAWTVAAEDDRCPLCLHRPDRHQDGCVVNVGYGHMTGPEECGCPAMPPMAVSPESRTPDSTADGAA